MPAAARVRLSPLPTARSVSDDSSDPPSAVHARVAEILQQIRPAVVADGGDVELLDITPEGVARVRFHGACVGCPSSNLTLHMGIERAVKAKVPEVVKVIAV